MSAAPRFAIDQRVRVLASDPPGHVRAPFFTRGHVGRIASIIGREPNPEAMAYERRAEQPVVVYRVVFAQTELWPDYEGHEADSVQVDVYEHWLEAVDER